MNVNVSPSEVRNFKFGALAISAVTLTVAYAWSNAVNSLIDQYVPTGKDRKNAWYKVLYAFILTVAAAVFMKLYYEAK